MKTLEEVKAELRLLHKLNPNVDTEIRMWNERSQKARYDFLVAFGALKEAEKIADAALALKIGEKLIGINELDTTYTKAFAMLDTEDRNMAILAFRKGKTQKQIAKIMNYEYITIRHRFCGKNSIYKKILDIINGGGG